MLPRGRRLRIFPLVSITGWTFDVKRSSAALGYPIVEIPIHWYYKSHSRVKVVLRDSITMGLDL